MKQILLSASGLCMVSCALPDDPPPGMPLEREHGKRTRDEALAHIFR